VTTRRSPGPPNEAGETGEAAPEPAAATERPSSEEEPGPTADRRAARAERRRTERRQAILEAAKRVFRDRGYHQVSVHDIIDEARIARGTFYLYFTSKQEVFGELVDEFLQIIRQQVQRIVVSPDQPPPLEQLRANFRRVVTTVLAHDDVASVILRDPTGFDSESWARVGRFFETVQQLVVDALHVGRGMGFIRVCDDSIVAATSLGGLKEVLQRMLAANTGEPDARHRERAFGDPEHLADELLQFLLRGLLGSGSLEPSRE
jgi:AcrR family transcriptional regulator